jgi:apolipoprotein N-acyltransferase
LNFLLAAVSALFLILAFPRFDLAWLAPVALTPLLVALAREDRPHRRFGLGYLCGIIYWFAVCYWIQGVLEKHGGVSAAIAWASFALFCLAKAIHMGVFALAAGILIRRGWAIAGVAAAWVAVEVTHGPLGFAWLTLGNAGIGMSVPMRLAPYTGTYGLSCVFAMMATALALAILRRPRWQLAWLALLAPIVLLPRLPDPQRGEQTAVLVQPHISETEPWTPEWVSKTERALVYLSMQAALTEKQPPNLLVWPEAPAPFYYDDPHFRDVAATLARTAKTYFLAGVVGHTPKGEPLNSAMMVGPAGEPLGRYDKVNLVPFGEFVPWPFDFIKKISSEAGDFQPGNQVVVFPVGTHKVGAFICYESVFPNFVRRFADAGADLLINISNDGWYGASAARWQHLEIVRMRAAENRRWLLRATNDGITSTIDPAGRVLGTLPNFTEAASRTGFSFITGKTIYTRWGDWFPLVCAVATIGMLGWEWWSVTRAGSRARPHP